VKSYNPCALIFLLLLPLFASARRQPNISEVSSAYGCINQAELSICANNYQAADSLYSAAYTLLGKKMSSKSLHNYFLLSADLNKDAQAKALLKELKGRGWAPGSFAQEVEQYYPASRAATLIGFYNGIPDKLGYIDRQYAARLDSIVAVDQYTNNYLHKEKNAAAPDSFVRLTRKHIGQLSRLFADRFPADALVGRGDAPTNTPNYSVVLIHNAQVGAQQSFLLDPVLYKAVAHGDMEPEEFAYYFSWANNQSGKDSTRMVDANTAIKVPLFPYSVVIVGDSLFQFPAMPERVAACNAERAKIPGCSPAEAVLRKLIHQYYDAKYRFDGAGYITRIDFELPARIKSKLIYLRRPV
jgi:hypothetical protein